MSTVADVPSVASNPAVASFPCCCCFSVKILVHLLLLVALRMLIVAGRQLMLLRTLLLLASLQLLLVPGAPETSAAVAGVPWIAINPALLASLLLLFVRVSCRRLPSSLMPGVDFSIVNLSAKFKAKNKIYLQWRPCYFCPWFSCYISCCWHTFCC